MKGIDVARQARDLAGEKVLLTLYAWVMLATGSREEGQLAVEQALRIVVEPKDPMAEIRFGAVYTAVLGETGNLKGVVEFGLAAIARAEQGGQPSWLFTQFLRTNVCEALAELGEIDRAAVVIDPVTDDRPTRDTSPLYMSRADLDMRRGRLSYAARFWDGGGEGLGPKSDRGSHAYICALRLEPSVWIGDPARYLQDSFSALRDLTGTDFAIMTGPLFVLALRACADLAEMARASGAEARLAEIEQTSATLAAIYTDAKADPFAERPLPVTGPAHGLSWRAEWTRLKGASDAAMWDQAACAWEALSRPHRAAYARWRQAEALLATPGGRTAAIPVLRTAARQAVQHVPLTNAIRDLARRARIELATAEELLPPEPAPASGFDLTDRELAVLALLTQGRTNSEIGAALFISRKTASVHVSNILRKLNVATRVQAAAVAERAGLLATNEASHNSTQ